ncbi:interleukin-7 receptor subunit alpha [Scleropages formosus]|uniref:Interleukin-7 receptor subunit alpha-like n=1 Tax=Scleropages formosus TaxID=113540 RepID=A0A8C9VHJ2_SCLFO|nr:interleukin-7 receptor subunit alpha [Scleropages formosus]
MAPWYWATLPFILSLSLALAQSGGGDEDPFELCYSSIRINQVNFTCQLEDDLVGEVTFAEICPTYSDTENCSTINKTREKNIIFRNLCVLSTYTLKVHFKTREPFTSEYLMTEIIKPNPPRISSATFLSQSNHAIIAIESGYSGDYLDKKMNISIRITDRSTVKKYVILQDKLIIEGVHLRENMIYHVQARMIPSGDYFRGFWSDWSPSSQFQTPKEIDSHRSHRPKPSLLVYVVIFVPLILLMILVLGVLRWHKEIRSVVWPSIPNPKNTLVQGYKPKKGPPVSFNPEAFIDNNIHLIDRVEDTRAVPDILERLGGCEFRGHGSSERYPEAVPRSSNSSVGESQPMLQSKSRGDKEGLEGDKLSHSLGIPGTPGSSGRSSGDGGSNDAAKSMPVPRREEAYVTMSSFYKTQ